MVKSTVQRRKSEAGQAVILVIVASTIFLFGAVGLAIDGSHMYAQRQMAQAAADGAAQAGIMSIFDGTNGAGAHAFATNASFTCASAGNDAKTPCYYAQTLNGFNTAGDTVTVDFPTSVPNVPTASLASGVNLIKVTVQRSVSTTLIRFLGPTSGTISAIGVGAILSVIAPIPIIVTHPTLANAFDANGTGTTPKIKICGGPTRSVQVNSNSQSSLSASGNPIVDLSHAGPLDPGNCTTGTGADFGAWGGPTTPPFVLQAGVGRYIQSSWIADPLLDVSPPPDPGTNAPAPTSLAQGTGMCPSSATHGCTVFSPGRYNTTTGKIEAKNTMAFFKPGIYYVSGVDFDSAANGDMAMATGVGADPVTGWAEGQMLVYMTGPGNPPVTGQISVGANGTVNLGGSPLASAYKNILFFVDRNAATQTHTLDGGGGLTLTGTVYMPETRAGMLTTPTRYQTLSMQGNAGSATHIVGEIITSALTLGGTPGIVMNLNASTVFVRQIALVH